MDTSKFGKLIGSMHYGKTVEFWFESLDGDSTDSRQISVSFPSEEIAAQIAEACSYQRLNTPTL